jgi:hypothetical protein
LALRSKRRLDMSVTNETKFPKSMIKNDQDPRNHEHHFRILQIVPRMDWHSRLEKSNDVVADVTNRAADEMGNVGTRDKLKTRQNLLELCQWIAFTIDAIKKYEWIEADERKPAGFFISFSRFKKKTWSAVVDLGESGDWRLDVRDQIDNQRDEIAALGEFAELLASRRNRMLDR